MNQSLERWREKKVVFCLTVTSTASEKGKDMQAGAENRAAGGKAAAGQCSNPCAYPHLQMFASETEKFLK